MPLHPASSVLIKRASRVAIVILSCWALCYLEGNQMRTRSGEQDGVNVRQPKVICALCLEMFWYAEERMPGNTNQSPLWVQFDVWVFKYRFFLQYVCILNKSFFGVRLKSLTFCGQEALVSLPYHLCSDPNYIIHLICSNSLLLFFLIPQPSTAQAHQHSLYFVKLWWFIGASVWFLFLV